LWVSLALLLSIIKNSACRAEKLFFMQTIQNCYFSQRCLRIPRVSKINKLPTISVDKSVINLYKIVLSALPSGVPVKVSEMNTRKFCGDFIKL
jgi:hypothetical protein